ncbi:hypothetical protein [Streptomyces sp. 2A115]|uniref:hypothetical protein n=1 Tax=Streptomyces sp. 2A115 TaxID=3457439 RepID=UPI003FD38F6A
MRKFQQAMIAAVAAGGLSAIGAGAGTAYAHDGAPHVSDLYRPYQECSPQTVAQSDLPVAVLGLSETFDTTCGQYNNAFTD